MTEIVLTSFFGSVVAVDGSWRQRQSLLHHTAVEFGKVDRTVAWTREDLLPTDFYIQNKSLLDEPRGCGYWAWKPWVILQTLKTVSDGDYVIYHDIGKPFRKGNPARGGSHIHGNVIELPVHSIIRWAEKHDGMFPGVNTPHYGPASQWSKRDCFVGMDCDYKEIWELPLIQAGYNAWRNSPHIIAFLEKWLAYCCDRRLVSDDPNVLGKPNFPDFTDHRHDQSVFTNLVRREGVQAYGSETVATPYVRGFNYLIRRVGLDAKVEAGEETLTTLIQSNGGSKNLPVSVTNWIDLDLNGRDLSTLNFLMIRASDNNEEKLLRSFASDAEWDSLDLSDLSTDDFAGITEQLHAFGRRYNWIFAYGFKDHALLTFLAKTGVRLLKPMAYMLAGLDASQHFVKDNTFDRFIKDIAQTRKLTASRNASNQSSMDMVIGTATNPVELKKRRGKAIVASIQAGLPASYFD